ncbi:restriction endonuclease [uncultured Aquimarina sp.]|uniref:restriction endonuclease n=1 Tax=uncultured Aquimarina sp. TaxID=575652 RepID=UPI00261BCA8C|nr:restriction endonuclease [uncultured Aquimarina sp.]
MNRNFNNVDHFVPKNIVEMILENIDKREGIIDATIPHGFLSEDLKPLYHNLTYISKEWNELNFKPLEEGSLASEQPNKPFKGLLYLDYNLEPLLYQQTNKIEFLEIVDNTKQLIRSIYNNNDQLTKVDSRGFEKIIADLLHSKGYEVELTKRTRDGGYDIIALTKVGTIPFKLIAECKRSASTVGVGIVRSFCDVIFTEKANKGIIFTSSYFSEPAKVRKNQMGALLDLHDRDNILKWVIDYITQQNE